MAALIKNKTGEGNHAKNSGDLPLANMKNS